MALHLNLHHEIAQQQLERRRDPLRLGLYGIALLGVCLVGFYLIRLNQVRLTRADLKRAVTEWDTLEKQQKVAEAREKELNEVRLIADNLQSSIDTRFFWAPFLQELGKAVPRNVQLDRMTADITPDNQLTVNLEGVAAGVEPRAEAERFRVGLAAKLAERYPVAEATFRSLEDSPGQVNLDGQDLEVAMFNIRVDADASGAPLTAVPAPRLTLAESINP